MQETTDVVTLATTIRGMRTKAGLSQQALASQAGLSIRTVARIERGEDTTVGTLTALAAVFGVAVSDILSAAENAA